MEVNGVVHQDLTGDGKPFTVAGFLKKVLTVELGGYDDDIRAPKLFAVALHAVFLESGFVPFNMKSKKLGLGFAIQNENWRGKSSEFTLFYSVPAVLNRVSWFGDAVIELKFIFSQSALNVSGSRVFWPPKHSVSLNLPELAPFLKITWSNFRFDDEIMVSTAREVLSFWNVTKDKLVSPLLIDLCTKSGLSHPATFPTLPDALKVEILRLLPQKDAARMGCVSKEFRSLMCNDPYMKKHLIKNSHKRISKKSDGITSRRAFLHPCEKSNAISKKSDGITSRRAFLHPYEKINTSQRMVQQQLTFGFLVYMATWCLTLAPLQYIEMLSFWTRAGSRGSKSVSAPTKHRRVSM
ncbi:hypothetical protein DM860_012275 [Cuscuta australis]|uniref:F-box domain-containing protein n=1 Tax=Cuscuta australis TaxID=267555 RepID=A0A328E7W1_9ASTE|nr:hypothetical protein DM860_012275 [Cuscuta australis]